MQFYVWDFPGDFDFHGDLMYSGEFISDEVSCCYYLKRCTNNAIAIYLCVE